MTNLGNENLCADIEQAKRRAKSIKARMKELGYEMPLTHAYEALASSCGFRNWPTMKAQFATSSGVAGSFLDDLDVKLTGHENSIMKLTAEGHATLVYGPPGKGKTVLANALYLAAVKEAVSHRRELPMMGIVDVGHSTGGFAEAVKEILPADRRDEIQIFDIKPDSPLVMNPFDLPLGFRMPTDERLTTLTSFLVSMAFGKMERHARPSSLFVNTVRSLYDRASDQSQIAPKAFAATQNRSLAAKILERTGRRYEDGQTTWWQIVDDLVEAGEFDLAEIAQRYAVPTMEDFRAAMLERLDQSDVGVDIGHLARYNITDHMMKCKFICGYTSIDRGRAKITVINLGALLQKERDAAVARTAFYAARLGICRDVYMAPAAWSRMDSKLQGYHQRNLDARRSSGVHIVYDELHRYQEGVQLNALFADEIATEVKLAKRSGVSLKLMSQTSSSFGRQAALWATGIVLLDVPSSRRYAIAHDLGISEEFIDKVGPLLTGPIKERLPLAIYTRVENGSDPIVNLNLNSTALWTIAPSGSGSDVRTRLAKRVGFKRAVIALSKRFPTLTARYYIEAEARRLAAESAEYSYRDLVEPVTESLIAELAAVA